MKKLMKWLLGCYLLFFCGFGYSVSCLNGNGKEVDWWIMIKRQGAIGQSNDAVYIDSTEKSVREVNLKDKNALSWTLKQTMAKISGPINQGNNTESYTWIYNDQSPNSNRSCNNCGHSKGIVAFNESQGFWVVHSLPRFPTLKAASPDLRDSIISDSLPSNISSEGHSFAQNMLCISLPRYHDKKDQFKNILNHLLQLKVNFYPKEKGDLFYKDQIDKKTKSHKKLSLFPQHRNGIVFKSYSVKTSSKDDLDVYDYAAKLLNVNL